MLRQFPPPSWPATPDGLAFVTPTTPTSSQKKWSKCLLPEEAWTTKKEKHLICSRSPTVYIVHCICTDEILGTRGDDDISKSMQHVTFTLGSILVNCTSQMKSRAPEVTTRCPHLVPPAPPNSFSSATLITVTMLLLQRHTDHWRLYNVTAQNTVDVQEVCTYMQRKCYICTIHMQKTLTIQS